MGIFSKKTSIHSNIIDLSTSHMEMVVYKKQLLEFNANRIKALMFNASTTEKRGLQKAYIDIKYANPVVSDEINKIDNDIAKVLDDLKLLYSKRLRSELSIGNKIKDLLELIQQRQALE